jgi:hypothetical protein
VVAAHEAPWRASLALFAAFALLTVFIAVTGLYAMMAHTIVEQSREIGVRLVLGATPGRIAGGVIAGALSLAATGGLIGLAGAAITSRLMRSLLFGVEPLDPLALGVSPLLLAAVAVAACVFPAVRAARTDPAVRLGPSQARLLLAGREHGRLVPTSPGECRAVERLAGKGLMVPSGAAWVVTEHGRSCVIEVIG